MANTFEKFVTVPNRTHHCARCALLPIGNEVIKNLLGKHSATVVAVALLHAAPLHAQQSASDSAMDHSKHAAPSASASEAAPMIEGEVRKIDKEQGKITIRHGELKNLGMPAMTMVMRVRDAAMLDQVSEGQKVRFSADRANGAITVTNLEPIQ